MNIHTSRYVADVNFKNALMNGAYIGSKTLDDVKELAASACGAVVVGSISVEPRKPNVGQGYWIHEKGYYSLNSYGLPNGGMPYFEKHLPAMVEIVHSKNKPLIANVVGFSAVEFAHLVQFVQKAGVDMVELNLGCPNVWHKGKQKQIISYNASLVKSVLEAIKKSQPRVKICVKISPLPPDTLQEVCRTIVDSGVVHAVSATNSYPNASPTTETGSEADDTLAGLAGPALKPISLGVVKQLRQLLPHHIDIIGVGGIANAQDVADYLLAGAKAVQIATALNENGLLVFDEILSQS